MVLVTDNETLTRPLRLRVFCDPVGGGPSTPINVAAVDHAFSVSLYLLLLLHYQSMYERLIYLANSITNNDFQLVLIIYILS